ncbi:hypothetical protein [Paenibacillus luteus]|uniref:hypothetical protein n=1 Tax=Paenibacillus luteus TaxID=2545753 RepID=UPI001142A32E|nr:hypothetical protein [Paenibacillus luteus]
MRKSNIKLLIALVGVLFLASCTLRVQKTLSDEAVIQVVKADCSAWCLDNKDLIIEVSGYDERGHVMVGVWNGSNNQSEAGYHVDTVTGEITRKYILNGELESIENGVKASASQITDVTFSKMNDLSYSNGTSKLLSVTTDLKEIAKYRGSLITLFGDPTQATVNSENAFDYVIQAQRSDGSKWNITAYQGPSGFAIGGTGENELSHEIAYILKERLAATAPSDFEKRDIRYVDSGDTYSYGCRNGECYVE